MKQKRFLSRAASLGFYTLILRGASTVFGIWLSNTVGAEGAGLFQLVSSVYENRSLFQMRQKTEKRFCRSVFHCFSSEPHVLNENF